MLPNAFIFSYYLYAPSRINSMAKAKSVLKGVPGFSHGTGDVYFSHKAV
jgi:hypothetical protein